VAPWHGHPAHGDFAPVAAGSPFHLWPAAIPPADINHMSSRAHTESGRPRKLGVVTLLAGLAIAGGLAWYLHGVEESVLQSAKAQAELDSDKPPRPLAEVTQAVRSLKLVTVEIDTKVKVERGDSSWRGDVQASIESPVRLSYGTDLSRMQADGVTYSPLLGHGAYVIKVPRPTRISTEVFNAKANELVNTGWLRLRSRAGEYYLSQARKDVPEEARELVLLPEDAAKVEQVTKEQVTSLIKTIVGDKPDVLVLFGDAP